MCICKSSVLAVVHKLNYNSITGLLFSIAFEGYSMPMRLFSTLTEEKHLIWWNIVNVLREARIVLEEQCYIVPLDTLDYPNNSQNNRDRIVFFFKAIKLCRMSRMVHTPLHYLLWKARLEFVTISQHCPAARIQNHQMEVCKISSQLCSIIIELKY